MIALIGWRPSWCAPPWGVSSFGAPGHHRIDLALNALNGCLTRWDGSDGVAVQILMDETFLTEEEAAEILGMKVATLRTNAARRKGPPRVKSGRTVLCQLFPASAALGGGSGLEVGIAPPAGLVATNRVHASVSVAGHQRSKGPRRPLLE